MLHQIMCHHRAFEIWFWSIIAMEENFQKEIPLKIHDDDNLEIDEGDNDGMR